MYSKITETLENILCRTYKPYIYDYHPWKFSMFIPVWRGSSCGLLSGDTCGILYNPAHGCIYGISNTPHDDISEGVFPNDFFDDFFDDFTCGFMIDVSNSMVYYGGIHPYGDMNRGVYFANGHDLLRIIDKQSLYHVLLYKKQEHYISGIKFSQNIVISDE